MTIRKHPRDWYLGGNLSESQYPQVYPCYLFSLHFAESLRVLQDTEPPRKRFHRSDYDVHDLVPLQPYNMIIHS